MTTKTTPTLNFQDSQRLLEIIRIPPFSESPNRRSIRNYLMALIMLDAGLRVGELVKLRINDLFMDSKPVDSILVSCNVAKLGIARLIPTSDRLRKAVWDVHATDELWQRCEPGYYAFHASDPRRHLTVRLVEQIIKQSAIDAFGRPITPHTLRHTFATRLMRQSNIRVVQKLLGHKALTSTQIYTHPNTEDLRDAINKIDTETNASTQKTLENA